PDILISGDEAWMPEKKATPSATIQKMEIKRAVFFFISIQKSLCSAFFTGFTYHSISSTGVGCAFRIMSETLPFLMRMTLSAMGVRAELWVMTITVIPFSLHMSCRSFRIALPV